MPKEPLLWYIIKESFKPLKEGKQDIKLGSKYYMDIIILEEFRDPNTISKYMFSLMPKD